MFLLLLLYFIPPYKNHTQYLWSLEENLKEKKGQDEGQERQNKEKPGGKKREFDRKE